jgi:hypothetical protein
MTIYYTSAIYEAYRKSKADLFFERSVPNAKKFAEYEDRLEARIAALAERLAGQGRRGKGVRYRKGKIGNAQTTQMPKWVPDTFSPPKTLAGLAATFTVESKE